jgi:glycosyltransferase involved in cell wall biosynthesis
MPNSEYNVSYVMPAYNEEANIREAVERAKSALDKLAGTHEIIVVDDGSTDGTAAVLDGLAQNISSLRVIRHEKNAGYGTAIRNAFSASKYELLFFTDSDLQFDPDELEKLLPLSKQFDIVTGYRIKRRDPAIRLFVSWVYNRMIRLMFGLRVRDVNCAFKLINRRVVETVGLESNDFFIAAELLCKASARGFSIHEIGVNHYPRNAGRATVKPGSIMRTFRELLRIRAASAKTAT